MSGTTDVYAVGPGVTFGISGPAGAREHFAREYGPARVADGAPPDVLVGLRFARSLPGGVPADGHKTVRWSLELGAPEARPLRARITVAGRPRRFALSLVQGFVVEPLVSVAAADADLVLLPAAALVEEETAVVLLGRSRSGKTSVVARAVASGRDALGDDQILVDGAGGIRSWPRRLRVYPDLRLTAPNAVAALPWKERSSLRALRWIAVASRGAVAPSLPLPLALLGGRPQPGRVPARRVVVVTRGEAGTDITSGGLQPSDVVAMSAEILREQRIRLERVTGPAWHAALQAVEARERRTLTAAFGGMPAERWSVPAVWTAPEAVGALAARLGVDGR